MDRLDYLFQEWHRLGGAVLLARVDPSVRARRAEEVIAESTAHCRESARLMWVVLDWLIQHVDRVDAERLLQETLARGDLSVLGVLCDAARQRKPHPTFDRLIHACVPHTQLEPFFYRVARSALAAQQARENAIDVFRRWNYLSSELRYLQAG